MVTAGDIFDFIDEIMPFSKQEGWDNSGFLAGDRNAAVNAVMTCLDISMEVIEEASQAGAELIVSHHPVIFEPIKSVTAGSPVYELVRRGISAICCHTNADIAEMGTNGIAYEMMKPALGLGEIEGAPEEFPDGGRLGFICGCTPMKGSEMAAALKKIFGCDVRYYAPENAEISRVMFCSGSGGSFIRKAASAGAALITGDVKHDKFVDAVNMRAAVFDCTHYGTERPFAEGMAEYIGKRFPELRVIASQRDKGYIRSV